MAAREAVTFVDGLYLSGLRNLSLKLWMEVLTLFVHGLYRYGGLCR